MDTYDIAVVGAGPAGIMASIRASQLNKNIILIEKNASIGVKVLLTGAGRCNITNSAPIDTFIEKFGKQGNFLRTAFYKFSNLDLINFLESKGALLKSERQGRVFPATDRAASIIEALKKCLEESGVSILYNEALLEIEKKEGLFELKSNGGKKVYSKKAVMSTGGVSYAKTGSSGDGFRIAKQLGHTVVSLKAALVPLVTKERWVKELQGVSLENIRLTFLIDSKKIISNIGELMFTHFGVSGPLVLDLSGKVVAILPEAKEARLFIDLKPGLEMAKLEARLLRDFTTKGSAKLATIIEGLLPKRMAPLFMRLANIDNVSKKASHINKGQRRAIAQLLKALPLTITGALSIDKGMVTNGGISTKEINPRTMESKIIPGLYFAGEIIDGAAPSGGYNLQQAFSTGFLAGEAAACAA